MQNNSSASGVGGFSPILIPQLKVWLDASLGVTQVSGAVSAWQSQAPQLNIHFDQATGANKPTLVAAQANGLPVVRFNGTSSVLTKAGDSTGLATLFCHVLVFKANGSSTNSGTPYSNGCVSGFTNHNYGIYLKNTTPISLIFDATAGSEYTDTYTFDTTAFHIAVFRHDGTGLYSSVDGGTETFHAQVAGAGFGGSWNIGLSVAYGSFDLAEMLMYTTYVNPAYIRRVQAYLASKYNITLAS